MSGSYNATFPQRYQQQINGHSMPEDISNAFYSTPNNGNTEPAEFETARVLCYFVRMTKSQLDLLAETPYAYVCTQFLEQLSRGDISLNQAFHLLSLRDSVGSPPAQLQAWGSVAGSSQGPGFQNPASTQPNTTSAGMTSQRAWHRPIPPQTTNVMPENINMPPGQRPNGLFYPGNGSPSTSTLNHNTSSNQSVRSQHSGQHSTFFAFDNPASIPESTTQPYGTPRSMACSQPYAPLDQEALSDLSGSPEAQRRPSVCSSQLSDTPARPHNSYSKWVNSDPARIKTNKKKRGPKTSCPRCPDSAYENRAEFVKHMIAVHEQPVEFICNHYLPGKAGDQYFCSESKWHFSSWAKHHTQQHSGICGKKQVHHSPAPACRQEIVKERPVRQRGCWLCNHLSFTVEHWVDHHLGRHKGAPKKAMSQTWAMKSLLSNPDITMYWQVQIKNLEITTGYFWDLKWAKDVDDVVASELINSLETGFFKGKNFHDDLSARTEIAEAVMDATIDERERLGTISPQSMQDIRRELHDFRRYLVATARSAADLVGETKRLKRAASSSPLSGYPVRDQVVPWLRTQCEVSDLRLVPLELELDGIAPSCLDEDERLT